MWNANSTEAAFFGFIVVNCEEPIGHEEKMGESVNWALSFNRPSVKGLQTAPA